MQTIYNKLLDPSIRCNFSSVTPSGLVFVRYARTSILVNPTNGTIISQAHCDHFYDYAYELQPILYLDEVFYEFNTKNKRILAWSVSNDTVVLSAQKQYDGPELTLPAFCQLDEVLIVQNESSIYGVDSSLTFTPIGELPVPVYSATLYPINDSEAVLLAGDVIVDGQRTESLARFSIDINGKVAPLNKASHALGWHSAAMPVDADRTIIFGRLGGHSIFRKRAFIYDRKKDMATPLFDHSAELLGTVPTVVKIGDEARILVIDTKGFVSLYNVEEAISALEFFEQNFEFTINGNLDDKEVTEIEDIYTLRRTIEALNGKLECLEEENVSLKKMVNESDFLVESDAQRIIKLEEELKVAQLMVAKLAAMNQQKKRRFMFWRKKDKTADPTIDALLPVASSK